MLATFPFIRRLIALFAVLGLLVACSSDDDDDDVGESPTTEAADDAVDDADDVSEDEAEDRIDAVLAAFEAAAGADGFAVEDDDDDDDDDDNRLECEGFDDFGLDGDTVADDKLSVTDGNEPVATVEDGALVFEGGELSASVDVGVVDDDRLERMLSAVEADPDAFATCMKDQFEAATPPNLPDSELSMDVEVEIGDAGDQEVIVHFDGVMTGTTDGASFEIELRGYARYVRVGTAALVAAVESTGVGVDLAPIEPAIEAALDEFTAQFA